MNFLFTTSIKHKMSHTKVVRLEQTILKKSAEYNGFLWSLLLYSLIYIYIYIYIYIVKVILIGV